MNERIYGDLTYKIIGIAMKVHSDLGSGFLEKVYENAMMVLLEKEFIKAEQQKEIAIDYYGKNIGNYIADILVDEKVIIELKTVDKLTDIHSAQIINYLKATEIKVGLLINFKNSKLEYKRFVY